MDRPRRRTPTALLGLTILSAALLLLASALPACTGAYGRLKPESGVPKFADVAAIAPPRALTTTLVPVADSQGRVVRIAVHESPGVSQGPEPLAGGDRASDAPTIVLIHGMLSSHLSWRHTLPLLPPRSRLILVDMPGCGASDAPDPASCGPESYSIPWLADLIFAAVGDRLDTPPGSPASPDAPVTSTSAGARAVDGDANGNGGGEGVGGGGGVRDQPGPIYILAHSLGGAIVLRSLTDPALTGRHAAVLDRLRGAVLIAPLDVDIGKVDPNMRRLATMSGWEFDLAELTGLMRAAVAEETRLSFADPAEAPKEEADERLAILQSPPRRRAMQAMMRAAVPLSQGRPDWERIEALTEAYAEVRVPVLLIWGSRDEILPVSMGYKLAAQLPLATLRIIPRAKHSPHIEDPRPVGEMIRRWIDRGEPGLPVGRR